MFHAQGDRFRRKRDIPGKTADIFFRHFPPQPAYTVWYADRISCEISLLRYSLRVSVTQLEDSEHRLAGKMFEIGLFLLDERLILCIGVAYTRDKYRNEFLK